MQFRRSTFDFDRFTNEPHAVEQPAGGNHHGPSTDGQHPAFCHVRLPRQPASHRGNRCSIGRLYPATLHPHDLHTLVARLTDSIARQPANAQSDVDVHVPVGGRRDYRIAWTILRNNSVILWRKNTSHYPFQICGAFECACLIRRHLANTGQAAGSGNDGANPCSGICWWLGLLYMDKVFVQVSLTAIAAWQIMDTSGCGDPIKAVWRIAGDVHTKLRRKF